MPDEKFVVDSLVKANWAMDKITEKRNKIAEIEAAYAAMVAKYDTWRRKETETLEGEISSLEALLRPWVEKETEGQKKKSVNLASGRVGFKKGKQSWNFAGAKADNDNAELLKWAAKHAPEFVNVSPRLCWGELKKMLRVLPDGRVCTEDGELVESMTVEQGDDIFYAE